jgi:predicted ArsR family transcriptional regulator
VDDSRRDVVSDIAALDHPVSRAACQLVVERGWVGRDEAAAALDQSRSVVAFHLDKLVQAGLLDVRFERTSGRTGPGAGRPSKLYGRSGREINVSLPPRQYDLAGSVLADAVIGADAEKIPVRQALADVARRAGRDAAVGAPAGSRAAGQHSRGVAPPRVRAAQARAGDRAAELPVPRPGRTTP